MPTLEEAQKAEAAIQKKKDDAMKEYLTIPKDGKPPNVDPPPEALTEAQHEARNAEMQRLADEKAAASGHATQAPAKSKPDDDDDKPKSHTIGGKR
jgi:hypothetical protein